MSNNSPSRRLSPEDLQMLLETVRRERSDEPFRLARHFNADNIVEIANSQFPQLEAAVAKHLELEKTKRLLIVVAAVCLLAGAALVVFAPESKTGVAYVIAALLGILRLVRLEYKNSGSAPSEFALKLGP